MSLTRQGRHFLAIGLLQWVIDCTVMMGLSHAGVPVEPANLAGRVSGAMLGFWLNGRITFASEDTRVGRRQLGRFVLMWMVNTALSTWSLSTINGAIGLRGAWLAKPAVEVALAGLSFVLSRNWIYKR
ncbi:GtrA family protein [Montanilutibacter psychrotolerans]|uniref:GtrA family protein n=1 Tax=Montanilutibacter psychrotolerans TaxID=1327343 RepID=A0A3M8SSL9_9GAMM|nr:GtrA family protein [Lysobacter psychrotolerans]RNF82214.1 GtrA family protein [Lysobacter psychrotolerans]